MTAHSQSRKRSVSNFQGCQQSFSRLDNLLAQQRKLQPLKVSRSYKLPINLLFQYHYASSIRSESVRANATTRASLSEPQPTIILRKREREKTREERTTLYRICSHRGRL